MRYRPPTQLHASLYMRDKKRSTDSKVSEDTKATKPVSTKKTTERKSRNLLQHIL
jgi:hypothetical protein